MSGVDLSEFLLARIAEDEEVARVMVERFDPPFSAEWTDNAVLTVSHSWTPARVLAECEAKRRIVEDMPFVGEHAAALLLRVGQMLALPYADHPDYREEWRP